MNKVPTFSIKAAEQFQPHALEASLSTIAFKIDLRTVLVAALAVLTTDGMM
eukprot:m.111826 g.111826  ORF g.111826 m.111826 type:complete len:51 (-) comp17015_c0_seq1:1198-1350(-)